MKKIKQLIEMDKMCQNIIILEDFMKLKDNWNQYGAKSFERKLIDKCKNIIPNLKRQPFVYPTARSSIQFEYNLFEKEYLEFEIFEEKITFFYIFDKEKFYLLNEVNTLKEEDCVLKGTCKDIKEMNRLIDSLYLKKKEGLND